MARKAYTEYQKLAESYDKRWSGYLRHTYSKAIELLKPEPGDFILDSSGGTGGFCDCLLQIPETKVVIADFSENMLEKAAAKYRGNTRISFVHSDIHQLPFDSGRFSKVYNLSALHFYDDAGKAVSELVRVCKPGGEVLILDWSSDTFIFRIFFRMMKLLGKPVGKIISIAELQKLITESGLILKESGRWSWRGWSFASVVGYKPES